MQHQPLLWNLGVPGVELINFWQLDIMAAGFPLFGSKIIVADAMLCLPLTAAGAFKLALEWVGGLFSRKLGLIKLANILSSLLPLTVLSFLFWGWRWEEGFLLNVLI